MKKIIVSIILLKVFVNLFFMSCGPKNDIDMEYVGESDKWQVVFEVKPLSFEEDDHRYAIDMEAKYLGVQSDLEGINGLRYDYRWIHQDAEFVDEDGMDVEFHEYTSEPIDIAFGRGCGMYREDSTNLFFGQQTIEEDISDFADYIRLNLKWNEQEEVFNIYKRQ